MVPFRPSSGGKRFSRVESPVEVVVQILAEFTHRLQFEVAVVAGVSRGRAKRGGLGRRNGDGVHCSGSGRKHGTRRGVFGNGNVVDGDVSLVALASNTFEHDLQGRNGPSGVQSKGERERREWRSYHEYESTKKLV